MNVSRLLNPVILGLVTLSLPLSMASADQWPMERQNPQRTAWAEGTGTLTTPAVRGRVYLGGYADSLSTWVGDPNQDGDTEIVLVAGGKVVMKDSHDRVLWDTINLQAEAIDGAFDFDGDGNLEILVLGTDGLLLLNGRNGDVLWHVTAFTDDENRAAVGGTRVVDFNGDGLPDIIVKIFWAGDGLVHGYTFGSGINSANPTANQAWQHDIEPSYDQGYFPAVGDVDNDGIPDVVNATGSALEVFPANTGGASTHVLDTGEELAYYFGTTEIVNMDDDPQNEIFHFTAWSHRSVEIFDLVRSPDTPIIQVVWDDADQVTAPAHPVHDLDGNGTVEFGINRYNSADGRWEGRVYQYVEFSEGGATAMLAEVVYLENEQIVDFVDLDGDGKLEILTRVTTPGTRTIPAFYTVRAYRFQGEATRMWELDAARWHFLKDRGDASLNPVMSTGTLAHQDVDGDGGQELYISRDTDGDQKADSVALLKTTDQAVAIVAEHAVDSDTRMRVIWTAPDISAPGAGPEALALDVNGRLWILGSGLEIDGPGYVAVGGFLGRPAQVVDLDGDGTYEVIARKSSGLVTALRPENTDQTGIPDSSLWSFDGNVSSQYAVAMDVDLDGAYEVVVQDNTDSAAPRIVLLDGSGTERSSLTLDMSPFNLFPAPLLTSATPDLFGMRWTADSQLNLFVVNGSTWTLAWDVPADDPTGGAEDNTAVAFDMDGDGVLDIGYGQQRNFCVKSGKTGDSLGCVNTRLYGGRSMVGLLDDTTDNSVAMVSSDHVTVLDTDLNTQWTEDFADIALLNRQPALADADGDGALELYFLGNNTVYRYNNSAETWSRTLAGGEEGEPGTGITLNGMAVGDIDGDAVPEVVVSSSDGYLYALDAQRGQIEWVMDFFYEVGNPVIGRIDDDDTLDIAVPVADGYLYLINQATLDAPENVRDVAVEPDLTLSDDLEDVDETEVAESLGAAWDPVPGAVGYVVAVVSEHDTYVVTWQDVGDSTTALIADSRLLLGQQYRVVVQAYDEHHDGSPWSRSDGVRIEDVTAPEIENVYADPDPFNPDLTSTTIHASIHDLTGLESYSVQVTDGDAILLEEDATTTGTSRDITVVWDGTDADGYIVEDGVYDIVVSATDVGGHETTATGTVEVTSRVPTPTPEPLVTPTPLFATPTPLEPTPSPSPTPTLLPPTVTPASGDDDTGAVEPTSPDPGGEVSPSGDDDDEGSCNCHIGARTRGNHLGTTALLLLTPAALLVRRRRLGEKKLR